MLQKLAPYLWLPLNFVDNPLKVPRFSAVTRNCNCTDFFFYPGALAPRRVGTHVR